MGTQAIYERLDAIKKEIDLLHNERQELLDELVKILKDKLDVIWRIMAVPSSVSRKAHYLDCCFETLIEAKAATGKGKFNEIGGGITWIFKVVGVPVGDVEDHILKRIGEPAVLRPYSHYMV